MRPLDELTARARGLRGVFTDIDDTLTHAGALVPAAYEKLVALGRAGLRVVPVTGRPAGWAAVLAATWPVDAVVAENGAVAFVRRKAGAPPGAPPGTIEKLFWDDAAARARDGARLAALRDEILAACPWARLADDQWLRLCDVAFDVGENCRLAPAQIAELAARIAAGGARSLVSTVHAHAFYGDWDKARMAARVARESWGEDLDAERGRYLFVGDSPNDAAGFAWFPLSAGVANVERYRGRMERMPQFVAPSEGGVGFAEIAEAVLAGIGGG